MTATCSGCRFNKSKKDPDIGTITCGCDQHGVHSPNSQACGDMLPIQTKGEIEDERALNELRKYTEKIKIVKRSEPNLIDTMTPLVGYVVAIAVVLILATFSFTSVASESLVNTIGSLSTILPSILVLVALLIAISIASKAVIQ